jgi:hypothetical protein
MFISVMLVPFQVEALAAAICPGDAVRTTQPIF